MTKTNAQSEKTTPVLVWHTNRSNAGQIVEVSDAQLSGAAEGSQGPAKGISVRFDRSDRSWAVMKNGKQIGSGKGERPSVEDAMAMANAAKAK